jgi:hypothetical protein
MSCFCCDCLLDVGNPLRPRVMAGWRPKIKLSDGMGDLLLQLLGRTATEAAWTPDGGGTDSLQAGLSNALLLLGETIKTEAMFTRHGLSPKYAAACGGSKWAPVDIYVPGRGGRGRRATMGCVQGGGCASASQLAISVLPVPQGRTAVARSAVTSSVQSARRAHPGADAATSGLRRHSGYQVHGSLGQFRACI